MLSGLYGHPVQLTDGRIVTADEDYLRESIVNPAAKVVFGWQPIMPTFKGRVSEDEIMQLIAYIQSIDSGGQAAPAPEGEPLFPTDRPAEGR